ncbi:UDP-glucose--hexose-1-phosphate uridylyltransferase [uncultured Kordia sp.]|uniref:UDP-glucose--hexose-1-phosphate uridylyltransferase n=1 Tax=uncultured Kordia sp. TaxID=507699 RepID=UPI00261F2AB5|nr:UDP-glucose--hexose-1-phosphate uridylyltransferase [uncultured Kordia sp.]
MDILKEPHIRKNILTGDEVLVSPHRTKRPWQGKVEDQFVPVSLEYDPNCYLCPGNTRASRDVNPNYEDTFVFTNDYAALKEDTEAADYVSGLLEAKAERGICRVVCFSPNHSLTLSKMEIPAIEKVITTWQREFAELSTLDFINNVQIFENRGDIMGCSNPHPHGQIWAQKSIPTELQKKTHNFAKYHASNQSKTLLEAYLTQEIQEKERIVYANEHFAVLVPFWAVWPFEAMIVPKKAMKNILEMTPEEITSYADAIKTITSVYDKVFNVPFPYSAGIHQAPTNNQSNDGWHWHMSFYPPLLRSATVKKFMVGYEMFAMPQRDITAEKAAEMLRDLV